MIVVIFSNAVSNDLLEESGLDEGSEYNEKLISISRGEIPPDRNIPVEWIMHDLWEDMKACDASLGEQTMEPVFTFMRAQTDKSRLTIHQLGEYLEYREKDVGQAYVLYISYPPDTWFENTVVTDYPNSTVFFLRSSAIP